MYDYYYSHSASIITEYAYSVSKYPFLWVPLLILDLPGYYKVLLSTLLHTPGQDMYGAPIHVQCWGVEHLTQQPWYLSQDYILDNLYLYSKLTIITLHFLLLLYSRLPEVTHPSLQRKRLLIFPSKAKRMLRTLWIQNPASVHTSSAFSRSRFFSSTEVLRPAYVLDRYKSSPRIDFRALSRYSCNTASEWISTSSATVILQETTNRDQALSFFQNERILQDARGRGVERLWVREGAFGSPACPVRPTYGSTTDEG